MHSLVGIVSPILTCLPVQVLKLFDDTRHELLLRRIQALNLQPLPPPAYSSSRRWLGDKPGFY